MTGIWHSLSTLICGDFSDLPLSCSLHLAGWVDSVGENAGFHSNGVLLFGKWDI